MIAFDDVQLIPVNGYGPEDVVVDGLGRVYTGLADGRIIRLSDEGRRIDLVADTGGRPLGIELFGDDELLVCDAERGVLVVSLGAGTVRTLVAEVAGAPMLFCNNAAVGRDGTVYFSDTSTRFPITRWRDDLIEQTGTGRLFRRSPNGTIDLLADSLHFANGVALVPDESCVVVAETSALRLRRIWLTGERAGTNDVFLGDLRGFPDNISTGSDGLIWVAQASPKVAALDRVRRLPALLRSVVRSLPDWAQPSPARSCGVLAVSARGEIMHDMGGEIDGFHLLTGVRECAGRLYFGSLQEGCVATTAAPGT